MTTPYVNFDAGTGDVSIGGISQTLRPKTFLLAQFLAERCGQVVSKDDIMAAVWADSIVEDQAIFQSVNEIRKAFTGYEVIKTHPRRGYTWLIPSTPQPQSAQLPLSKNTETAPTDLASGNNRQNVMLSLLLCAVLSIAGLGYWLSGYSPAGNSKPISPPESQHALLVLPFDTSQLDNNMHWLRFAAMDAVITEFNGQHNITVFQPDDVLDIVNRSSAGQNAPTSLFAVSAATLIVDGQLSGVPGDYHLSYTLYSRQSQQHNVIHATSLESLFSQVAQTLNARLSLSNAEHELTFEQQFNNTLLFNAMQLLNAGDAKSAVSFLQSAIVAMPEQADAYFWLAKALMALDDWPQALTVLEHLTSLPFLEQDSLLYSRTLYLKGSTLLMLQSETAHATLNQALLAAEKNQDWLYVAYAKSMLAQYFIRQQSPAAALPLLEQALSYQQMLQCPMGIVQGHLDFVDYYLATKQHAAAKASFQQAKRLVEDKQLVKVNPLIAVYTKKLASI